MFDENRQGKLVEIVITIIKTQDDVRLFAVWVNARTTLKVDDLVVFLYIPTQ